MATVPPFWFSSPLPVLCMETQAWGICLLPGNCYFCERCVEKNEICHRSPSRWLSQQDNMGRWKEQGGLHYVRRWATRCCCIHCCARPDWGRNRWKIVLGGPPPAALLLLLYARPISCWRWHCEKFYANCTGRFLGMKNYPIVQGDVRRISMCRQEGVTRLCVHLWMVTERTEATL